MDSVQQFKNEAVERFTNQESFAYFGELEAPPWGVLGFVGQHRDSDPLDRSNFEVITNDLFEKFPDAFRVESSSHWAVGWVEVVRIDTSNDAAVIAAMDWQYELEQYPVADEEHYSNLEVEEREEYYQTGGREDAISELLPEDDFAHIFDSNEELLPEYEDYLNRAFHDAEQDGSLSSYIAEHMEEQLDEKIRDDRREYEKYQSPIEGMEV